MDKNNVLITINKVHDRFGGVAAREGGGKTLIIMGTSITFHYVNNKAVLM